MKIQFPRNSSMFSFVLLFVAIMSSGAAYSTELPKRKSGLWETKVTAIAFGMKSSVQECIDHDSDNIFSQAEKQGAGDCGAMNINRQGNNFSLHSVCKVANSTATTDALFTGDYSSAYTGKIKTQFSPPVGGLNQAETLIDAKWLGPCPADREPGSAQVNLPNNGGTIDLNDPKLKALMESMKDQFLKEQK